MPDALRPNLILINCDDLGYGDLGCYGSPVNRTPALDRLATEGMRFTDFYMAAPVCSPSRGAMLTGCYPRRIGFGSFDNGAWVLRPGFATGLNTSEITIAGLLKTRGYETKLVGKWHCGDQPEFLPTRHGFDSFYGLPYSNDMGRQPPREHWPPLPLLRDEEVIQQQPDQAGLTERYTEECVRFLRQPRREPFFLYLAHMYVHLPIYVQERFLRESENGPYGAAVATIDWSTGVIMHELRRLGLEDNTLVIFTSDNGSHGGRGGSSNLPLRGGKGNTWEGGMRLPCIMRWPGVISAGSTCREVAASLDFLPTFAGLAGARTPDDRIIDGKDIRPLLLQETGARSPHEAFYYYRCDVLQAVRAGQWKLCVARDDQPLIELYDLERDPGETENVAERHPDIVRRLERYIDAAREDLGDAGTGAAGANCRVPGWVDNPRPLTEFDESYPYARALYD